MAMKCIVLEIRLACSRFLLDYLSIFLREAVEVEFIIIVTKI